MKHKVFLISAKQGGGKTTTADALAKVVGDYNYEALRTRYAKGVYEIHNAARDRAREIGIPYPDKFGALLQVLGTELGRNVFGENIWVDALLNMVNKEVSSSTSQRCIIIDDCRFINEFHAFDNTDFDVVKVRLQADEATRKARTDAWRDDTGHISETGLDEYTRAGMFDEVFHTNDKSCPTDKIVQFLCEKYLRG